MVLELCDCSLGDILEIRSDHKLPWNEDEILSIMKELLTCYFDINASRLCNRDIKPANILYNVK